MYRTTYDETDKVIIYENVEQVEYVFTFGRQFVTVNLFHGGYNFHMFGYEDDGGREPAHLIRRIKQWKEDNE